MNPFQTKDKSHKPHAKKVHGRRNGRKYGNNRNNDDDDPTDPVYIHRSKPKNPAIQSSFVRQMGT